MNTKIEESVVLSGLDFNPTCDRTSCEAEATCKGTWISSCEHGEIVLYCEPCAELKQRELYNKIEVFGHARCEECHDNGRETYWEDLIVEYL